MKLKKKCRKEEEKRQIIPKYFVYTVQCTYTHTLIQIVIQTVKVSPRWIEVVHSYSHLKMSQRKKAKWKLHIFCTHFQTCLVDALHTEYTDSILYTSNGYAFLRLHVFLSITATFNVQWKRIQKNSRPDLFTFSLILSALTILVPFQFYRLHVHT